MHEPVAAAKIGADTGTCFELGYMCAQGKATFAYTSVRADNGERTRRFYAGEVSATARGWSADRTAS